MGNICRSPAAEGVFQSLIDQEDLNSEISCDSAGTISFHTGNPADKRMRATASKRNIDLTSRARQIRKEDFNEFDLILTMDDENYENVIRIAPDEKSKKRVKKFCTYCTEHEDREVPDPYYGGIDGFEHVLDLLEDGCSNLLNELKSKFALKS